MELIESWGGDESGFRYGAPPETAGGAPIDLRSHFVDGQDRGIGILRYRDF